MCFKLLKLSNILPLLLIGLLLIGLSANVNASIPTENGDLESYLNGLTFGAENDGVFNIPTAGQLVGFENVVKLILQGNYELANTFALPLDYELVAYTDTVSAELYYVLREINPLPSPLADGGGTYVFQPSASYNVAVVAGHRWLIAVGPIDGNKSLMDISIVSGGLFDTATETNEVFDGTLTLTFDSCNSATVVYDIPSINQQGTVPIKRVANDNIALCEALSTDQIHH